MEVSTAKAGPTDANDHIMWSLNGRIRYSFNNKGLIELI
jgi:hypothetical protein